MSSQKAQQQRVLKLNLADKKVVRLLNCDQLSDKDSIFLDHAYQKMQKQHFWFGNVFPFLGIAWTGRYFVRFGMKITKMAFIVSLAGLSHIYCSALAYKRFQALTTPYYQKYSIK